MFLPLVISHNVNSHSRKGDLRTLGQKRPTEDFLHYVDEGFIDIDNCVAGYIESVLTPGEGALPHGANSASVTTTKTSPLIFV
jgi:hypothetical protein